MSKFFYRAALAAITFTLFLPLGAMAQEPQGQTQGTGQSTASPNSGQSEGGQRRGPWGRRGGRGRGEDRHMQMLARKLNLTDAQKQQFRQIGQQTRQQGMAIRNDSSLTDDQKKEKIQGLRKQAHQQMFGVLTPEQKDQLKQLREQHKKDQEKEKGTGDQASAKKPGNAADDDDPFAGMTSDDDDGPGGF
jgi:Spy/CpxP family protein refolding chaperone